MRKDNNGKMIAIFGPDGTGKSSIYEALENSRNKLNLKLEHYHWRPGYLPYKKALSIEVKDKFDVPHEDKSRNVILSLFLLSYIYLDFVLSYIFILRPKMKSGVNIFYERYFYDVVIDQKRYGLNAPYFLRKTFSKLVFSPDYCILLEAPSKIIYSRKKELAETEIDSQIKKFRGLLGDRKNTVVLDVSKLSAHECSDEVLRLFSKRHESTHE